MSAKSVIQHSFSAFQTFIIRQQQPTTPWIEDMTGVCPFPYLLSQWVFPQIDCKALFLTIFEATGQEVKTIKLIRDLIAWISTSNFFCLQLPEPIIGGLAEYPADVEMLGIKSQPVYTASFCHLNVEMFACKLCSHTISKLLSVTSVITLITTHLSTWQTHSQWYVSLLLHCEYVWQTYFNSVG